MQKSRKKYCNSAIIIPNSGTTQTESGVINPMNLSEMNRVLKREELMEHLCMMGNIQGTSR